MKRRHALLASAAALAPFLGCGSQTTTEDTVNAPVSPEDIQDYPDNDLPPKSAKPRPGAPR